MFDLQKLQQDIYANKIAKGFNVTDIALEFSLTHEELSEAFYACRKKLPDLGEELARCDGLSLWHDSDTWCRPRKEIL